MSKVISLEQISANVFAVNYLVDADEFTKIKEQVIEAVLKDVEVEGFRKGKAPRELALSKVEPNKLENTILQKTLETHEKPAVEAGITELQKKNRHHTGISLSLAEGTTKELEDGSFQFQLAFQLLPSADITKISQIKLPPITEDQIPNRPALENFIKQERDRIFCNYNRYEDTDKSSQMFDQVVLDMVGLDKEIQVFEEKSTKIVLGLGLFLPEIEKNLTNVKKNDEVKFDINFPKDYPNQQLSGKKITIQAKVKSVLTPQYADMNEVFEKSKQSSELKKQFGEADNVDHVITHIYDRETAQRLQAIKQREITNAVMKVVPDFDSDDDLILSEVDRLFGNLQKKTEENNSSLGEELVTIFPNVVNGESAKMSEKQVKTELEKQVREEFKWANILSYIYQVEVNDKPTQQDFEQVKKAAIAEPEKYGFTKETPKDQIENAIIDRIVRQVAFTWIVNQVDNTTENVSKNEDSNKITDLENKPSKKTKEKAKIASKPSKVSKK